MYNWLIIKKKKNILRKKKKIVKEKCDYNGTKSGVKYNQNNLLCGI